MWKEVISRREQFDISEADIFHFFSQKAQLPASVLVGGHYSGSTNPFQVIIDDKPWLSWSIKSKDLNMISYLCRRRQKDVADYIITDDKLSHELLHLLLSSDSASVTKTRVDFLRIVALKFYKHPNDGINYLKKYSIAAQVDPSGDTEEPSTVSSTQCTNPLILQALKEIRQLYPLRAMEKVALVAKLSFNVIFMSGWIFYLWALATDIEILYKSYACSESINAPNQHEEIKVIECSG